MASIIKRNKSYSVVYNSTDKTGQVKQKWETFHLYEDAVKRKDEIENPIPFSITDPPSNQKVSEFLYDFVCTYGVRKWGVSMYDAQTSLIANYINPIIGEIDIKGITPRFVDKFIQVLQKTPSVSSKTRKATDKTISVIPLRR